MVKTLSCPSPLLRHHPINSPLFIIFTSHPRTTHTVTAKRRASTLPISSADQDGTFSSPKAPTPLSLLPLPTLLRSYAITAMSSYPIFLDPSLKLLSWIAHSPSPILNPDRNPIIHYILKKTFYAQFCAGETATEVRQTARSLKTMGFRGVMLAYGKEIVLDKAEKAALCSNIASPLQNTTQEQAAIAREIEEWKVGTLKTVEMTAADDFVALKFSGAGKDALRQLAACSPPSPAIENALVEICESAQRKGVALMFDAEQDAVQKGIDAWTLDFQARYNSRERAVVYGTYQAYLKSAPATVTRHLAAAQKGGFALGVKLVRGAYMASDPRQCFWSTKAETDAAYDGITDALITKTWNNVLQSLQKDAAMPEVCLVLASHNQDSVKRCMAIRRTRALEGKKNVRMAYGQLMGMADEVSCELVLAAQQKELVSKDQSIGSNTYKYLVWGSVGECLKYLVRRAEENKDAVGRARGSRMALKAEVLRRCFG